MKDQIGTAPRFEVGGLDLDPRHAKESLQLEQGQPHSTTGGWLDPHYTEGLFTSSRQKHDLAA